MRSWPSRDRRAAERLKRVKHKLAAPLVMEAGRVRAIGSHAELAGNDDLYRRLATSQLLAAET